ncbi:MAG: hypothetical protein NTV88_01970 [Candidatus Micrarchaeota archaeon]|nr:hypothetical protein [Candidatus Micrarchaeota archaeon]
MGLRGASSLEYLFLTGIALSALALIIVISMNTGSDSIRVTQAKDSVEKLGLSADYVYSLGPGSRETVSVLMPQGIEFISISSNRIHMRITLSSGSSDVYAKANGKLLGKIPTSAGAHKITITTLLDGSVLFGDSSLDCSPARISQNIPFGGAGSSIVTIRNIAQSDVSNLSASRTGSVSNISTNSQPSPSSIAPNGTSTFTLQFTGSPVGIYSGIVEVSASNGTSCFTEISANVYNQTVSQFNASDNMPPSVTLAVSPNCQDLGLSVMADDTNSGGNAITRCEYQVDAGSWNYMLPDDISYDSPLEYAHAPLGARRAISSATSFMPRAT